ncbi:MAG: DUF4271 domain-containing protein [Bacteroidales bacterium]|nr:DUF4271 domain-containing protein [Bacteroidales bacterium]
MWETPFKSGELLMEQTLSQPETLVGGTPLLLSILVTVFVILALLELRNFLHVAPFLWDSVFRARGSVALENNVRVARERNQLTLILMIPAILFIYRYRLYDARFVQRLTDDWRLVAVAGVFLGYLLLRTVMYLFLKPRRRADNFRVAHRAGYTFFILLMLLAIAGVTILYFFRANDFIIKSFLYILSGIAYLVFLIRKTQILSISCNPLLTFLYLCGLEILPTGALIATAVLL